MITRTIVPAGKRTHSTRTEHRLQDFRFHGAVCQGCLLRSRCFAAKGKKGRQVLIHPPGELAARTSGVAAERQIR